MPMKTGTYLYTHTYWILYKYKEHTPSPFSPQWLNTWLDTIKTLPYGTDAFEKIVSDSCIAIYSVQKPAILPSLLS